MWALPVITYVQDTSGGILICINPCTYLVFLELLNRVLDLENETGDLTDYKLVVTVFQFAAYFRSLRYTYYSIECMNN